MSYDTLEHLDDNIFPQKDMEVRQKSYRAIKMIEQLGKSDLVILP